MRFNVKQLSFFLLTVLWAPLLQAADLPEVFNYQGQLLDEDGTPLGGSREAVFGVYDVPAGGTSLWEQKITVVTDTNGLFNVTLGGTTNSLSAAIGNRFSGLYLDMAFKIGGVMEPVRPRPQFVSVPYAKLAENMAGAQSLDVSSNLTIRQKATLKTLNATRATIDNLKATRITAPKCNVSSIGPNTFSGSIIVRVASPVVFHGFSPKGAMLVSPTSGTYLSPDTVNRWLQTTTDRWVSFSGHSRDDSSFFVFKMSPSRPDLAPSEYGKNDSRVTSFSTVVGQSPQGLCIPVPAGWWFGFYAFGGGAPEPLSSKFDLIDFRWIQGL